MPAFATTTSGSAENERPSAPIAGLLGFTSRSTTGARLRVIPARARVAASDFAQWRAAASVPTPISASDATAGNPCAGASLVTTPPSWSTAMTGARPAASRISLVRRRTWAGDRMLRVFAVRWSRSNRMTPPSPSRSAAATQGASPSLDPRNPTTRRPAIRCSSDGVAGVRPGDAGATVEVAAGVGPGDAAATVDGAAGVGPGDPADADGARTTVAAGDGVARPQAPATAATAAATAPTRIARRPILGALTAARPGTSPSRHSTRIGAPPSRSTRGRW